jgi:thiopeptide-type bacteriocin biosynthesis protein
MPADHLIPQPGLPEAGNGAQSATRHPSGPGDTVTTLEPAILAVLTGTPPPLAAAPAAIPIVDLIDAANRYQAAGQAALVRHRCDDWYQVQIEFADPHAAEHIVATRLGPRLRHAETTGLLTSWWYIRKTPRWRLRLHAEAPHREQLRRFVTDTLDELASQRQIVTWAAGVYEPETCAFGGPEAMEVAHRFFHADSINMLNYASAFRLVADPRAAPLGVRELSLLVCTALLRAAGQDWHEQGDVWHRVARMRPLQTSAPPKRLRKKVHQLLALDTKQAAAMAEGRDPLDSVRPWLATANEAGEALRELARTGTLRRGLRDVLAHHVIFHWNRLGITTAAQAILAHAAATTILHTIGNDSHPDQP